MQRLVETAQRDWAHSHKIDLSDAGLLHDLQKRQLDPGKLVLDAGAGKPVADKPKKHKGKKD